MTAADVSRELKEVATPEKAKASAWFFKTGPGEYGEGDRFIGVTLPEQRAIAKRYKGLPLPEIKKLVMSPIHEERLTGLIILAEAYKKGDADTKQRIYGFYLEHTNWVNNWDLVDSSAHLIVGPHLENNVHRDEVLERLARSESLWERRIAILSTFHYIKQAQPETAFKIAELLLNDKHDLIHKACGWMLREIGKKSGQEVLEEFLKLHYKNMSRTMLRYAIEKLPEERRKAYLEGRV
jgi:3-methyladenine DNA glycosylase AlkD